jgi:NAD(P)-dependent dehydrogenase (short-subunit alcohol dehydrogenase family)
MHGLNGKVALVTGAAGIRGMGRAIAIRLAKEGADVVVVDHPQAPQRFSAEARQSGWKGLDSTVEEIQAAGRQGLAVNADISSSSDVEDLVNLSLRKFGKIDILVNNAAIPGPVKTPVVNLEEETWKNVLQINLTGPFLLSRAVARSMIQRGEGGKIIMIASTAGKTSIAGMAAYSASKAGLISLTQTLALELAQYKINVNAICPGGVPTDMNYVVIEKLARERGVSIEEARQLHIGSFGVSIPLGRVGRVEDMASAVAFLASPDSDYITGQALNVCGGALVAR